MKHKNNEGSSLIEVLIAMAILAVIVIPVCSSLILSHRLNTRTEQVLQAQLDVASAVEYYMATGIPVGKTPSDDDYSVEQVEISEGENGTKQVENDRFPAVIVKITECIEDGDGKAVCYKVRFESKTGKMVTEGETPEPDVTVETVIRAVPKTEVTNDEEA